MKAAYDEFLERLDAGQDGTVLRSWVNRDFTQRAEPSDILDALRALQTQRRV